MNNNIEKWRIEIDAIDDELLSLLNKRARLATEIGLVKQREHTPLRDPDRERGVIARVCELGEGPLGEDGIKEIFTTIINVSRRLQSTENIAKSRSRTVVPKWNRVTIVGCGLIGASFALALKRSGACQRIAGWDSASPVLQEALRRGIIDEVDTSVADGAVSESDLIYLAMPVSSIMEFLRERGSQVRTGALVTDAGSTKVEICRVARQFLPEGVMFVGGHPIAGSQHSGLAYSDAELFRDAAYVLVHDGDGNKQVQGFEEALREIGALVSRMAADSHDRALAFTSHLPQLLSASLAATLMNEPQKDSLLAVSGKGLHDMTRLASSSWSMWHDIVETNLGPITAVLDVFARKVDTVRHAAHALSDGDWDQIREIEEVFTDANCLARMVDKGSIYMEQYGHDTNSETKS